MSSTTTIVIAFIVLAVLAPFLLGCASPSGDMGDAMGAAVAGELRK